MDLREAFVLQPCSNGVKMRTELVIAALGSALGLSAHAATAVLDLPDTGNVTSPGTAVFLAGSAVPVFSYGSFAGISPFVAQDAGFEMNIVSGVTDPLGGTTAGGTPITDLISVGNFALEPTAGPDAPANGEAADYFFSFLGGATTYFATAHVDAAGTLVSVTYGSVPEPGTWATMLLGFGLAGAALRRRTAALWRGR